jgi:hypothetical protein
LTAQEARAALLEQDCHQAKNEWQFAGKLMTVGRLIKQKWL